MTPSISIKSQLMKNHVAGRPLAKQSEVAIAFDAAGEPVLFALDASGIFSVAVTSNDSMSGWSALIDLGKQLPMMNGAPVTVKTFAASQGADGSIWIAVAASSSAAGAHGSLVYVSRAMPQEAGAADWQAWGSHLVRRDLPKPLSVERLALGTVAPQGHLPLLVLEGKDDSGEIVYYQVNPDPSDTSWIALAVPVPQDATACLAARPGYLAQHGLGVYTLCQLKTRTSLAFVPLPQIFEGQPISPPALDMALPAGAEALTAIAPLVLADSQTELFVGGKGLYRFDIAAQATSNLPCQTVETGSYFDGVSALEARNDPVGGGTAVWAIAKSDQLLFVRGIKHDSGVMDWQVPLWLDRGVTAFAAAGNTTTQDTSFAFMTATGFADGRLALKVEEPQTKLWRQEQVSQPDLDQIVTIETYTTSIVLRDDDGVAMPLVDVELLASFACAARINGTYRLLSSENPLSVQTTPDGTINIVIQTEALEAPVLTVSLAATSARHNPMDHVRDRMKDYTTEGSVISAERSDGSKVFPKGLKDPATVAATMKALVEVYDHFEPPAAAVNMRRMAPPAPTDLRQAAAPRVLLALARGAEGRLRLAQDHDEPSRARPAASMDDGVLVAAGDLFEALRSGVEACLNVVVREVSAGFEFVATFAGRTLRFIFSVASQALNAIRYFLEDVCGLDVSAVVDWLGFVFDWDAVLKTKNIIAHMTELGLSEAITRLQSSKASIHDFKNQILGWLTNDLSSIDTSNAIFASRIRASPAADTAPAQDLDPQSAWAFDHLRAGMPSSAVGVVELVEDVARLLESFVVTEIEIIKAKVEEFSQSVLADFQDLTFDQILDRAKNALVVIAGLVLDTLENAAITLIDAIEIIVSALRKILTAKMDIPVLSTLYKEVISRGQSELTLLDLICLVIAAPASIAYRAVTHAPLFDDQVAQRILQAKDFQGLAQALSAPPPQPRAAMLAALDSDQGEAGTAGEQVNTRPYSEQVLIGFYWVAAIGRIVSNIGFVYQELGTPVPGVKFDQRFKGSAVKLLADTIITSFSVFAMVLANADQTRKPSNAAWIDGTMTLAPIFLRLRDGFYIVYWYKTGAQFNDDKRLALSCVESAYGVCIFALAIASASVQFPGGPPKFLTTKSEKDAWTSATALKLVQNVMTGANSALACLPPILQKKGRIPEEKVARGARVGITGIATVMSLIRAALESTYDFADLGF